MFKLTCDNHIPVKPATKKKKINIIEKTKEMFSKILELTKVKTQLTTFIVAGNDINIVIVLYRDLLL
jgi:hypothetical protein